MALTDLLDEPHRLAGPDAEHRSDAVCFPVRGRGRAVSDVFGSSRA